MSARVLVINPNSSEAVTAGIDAALAPLRCAEGPGIDCVTLAEGPPGIETQAQVDGVVTPLLALIGRETAAAYVIACFSDPGLRAAREVAAAPVFGISESAMARALSLGERFGILAILPASVGRHRRYVRSLGLEARFADSLPIGRGVAQLAEPGATLAALVETGRQLRDDRGADVLILGCAGMAGYRAEVEAELGLPVVEPCQAAAAAAVGAVRLGW
ncbi:MAG: aspartate/glutamate racemase family protein [Kiloniellales bacterium]|nr:aspartate/glutamate racemase family protein [Kiloniellales bacterium]